MTRLIRRSASRIPKLAVGGFGLCSIPSTLIETLHRAGVTELRVASKNCGVDDWGLSRRGR